MKKFFTVVLTFIVLAGLWEFNISNVYAASTDELLVNPGFEEDFDGWTQNPPSDIEVVDTIQHSGNNCIFISNRGNPWNGCNQDITDALYVSGPGQYTYGAWVRLADGASAGTCFLVLRIKDSNGKQVWFSSPAVTLSTSWQKLEAIMKDIQWEADLANAAIYVQTGSDVAYKPDIYVDDFSLVKESPVNGKPLPTPIPDAKAITPDAAQRGDLTTVGAIRWDAWYGEPRKADGSEVTQQVEKTLSPAKYHFRVPFFGTIEADGTVKFNEYTQAIFDQEILYAADAGIAYWAYVWYDPSAGLSKARQLHVNSPYKDRVKMCSIFDANAINNPDIQREVKNLLKDSCWMTVQGGRPLMFYMIGQSTQDSIKKDISFYRAACEEMGIPAPFVALMGANNSTMNATVADCISDYTVHVNGGGGPYVSLAKAAVDRWNRAQYPKTQIIPAIVTGWYDTPRVENPVSWGELISPDSWMQYATPEELAAHLTDGLKWVSENTDITYANSMLMYAWNEHDEGGWICPTIKVDADGNPIKNADGTYQIDRSRLDAIKAVLSQYKSGKSIAELQKQFPSLLVSSPQVSPSISLTNSNVPTVTDDSTIANKSMELVNIIIGSLVIILAAGIIIYIKSKNKNR